MGKSEKIPLKRLSFMGSVPLTPVRGFESWVWVRRVRPCSHVRADQSCDKRLEPSRPGVAPDDSRR